MDLPGVDVVRFVAVAAVLYSHIAFYLVDDLGTGWWGIDLTYEVLVKGAGLNQHLSSVGVSAFMMLTGLLVTRSAIRQDRGKFLIARAARLLPAFWVSILAAVALVWLGINGTFSGHATVSVSEAFLSFFLGGFFLKPQVIVLGVVWTLAAQISFYLWCVAGRSLLRTAPVAVPMLGAVLCMLVLLYNLYVPEPYSVPFLSKVASTLPTLFLGQIVYLRWAGLISVRAFLAALFAQVSVIVMATDINVYWSGSRYLWTVIVIFAAVVLVARYDGRFAHSPAVVWVATRSYCIYLTHTLVMYRIYENTVGIAGTTVAIALVLIGCGLVAEVLYRTVEVPAAQWIKNRWLAPKPVASVQRPATATRA
ncbi:acyltransferase [Rhodococcus sp. NPDC047139]|uniref:acyltransferase family protein n=1 Tax=Rhodococcus sp. NPDC047139 TaxID=3155141 RepID=UPI0033DA2785